MRAKSKGSKAALPLSSRSVSVPSGRLPSECQPPFSRGSSRSRSASPSMLKPNHGERQRHRRPDREPRRAVHVVEARQREHAAPRRVGRRHAQAEAREARLGQDHRREPGGREARASSTRTCPRPSPARGGRGVRWRRWSVRDRSFHDSARHAAAYRGAATACFVRRVKPAPAATGSSWRRAAGAGPGPACGPRSPRAAPRSSRRACSRCGSAPGGRTR
jgi:hypothetical protein